MQTSLLLLSLIRIFGRVFADVFDKPSAMPNFVRVLPRRENGCRERTIKRKKNAGFTTRVLLATVFGIILGIAFKGHTDYVGAVGSIWSNAITALAVPLLLFSIISSITNLGESIRLKNIGAKTVSSCYLTPRRLRCLR